MARVDVKTIGLAAFATFILFMGVYGISSVVEEIRENSVTKEMDQIILDFEELETTAYLMNFLVEKEADCEVLEGELEYLESRLWSLDGKIKSYMETTRDFEGDEFYIKEKKRLNQREIIQLSMIEDTRRICGEKQLLILYFYGDCDKRPCDEQGFVLTYINEQIDPEIAILSFDKDLGLHSVESLIRYYNITDYPCTVIEGDAHCGLHDSEEMVELLCGYKNLTIC